MTTMKAQPTALQTYITEIGGQIKGLQQDFPVLALHLQDLLERYRKDKSLSVGMMFGTLVVVRPTEPEALKQLNHVIKYHRLTSIEQGATVIISRK